MFITHVVGTVESLAAKNQGALQDSLWTRVRRGLKCRPSGS